MRLSEFGCAAVDRGGNAPNLFQDPKSSESRLPPGSTGASSLSAFTGITGNTGFFMLPLGASGATGTVMYQWGGTPQNNTGTWNITFPTPFPNACWNVGAVLGGNGGNVNYISSVSTTGMTVSLNTSVNAWLWWHAIGS